MNKWTRVKFQPNLPLKESGRVTASKEHIQLSKEAAKEGMVLLKNENHLLPLAEGTRIALFGKGSFDYVKGGGGSGDVMVSYVHNLYDGLKMQENAVQIYEPLSAFYKGYTCIITRNNAMTHLIMLGMETFFFFIRLPPLLRIYGIIILLPYK